MIALVAVLLLATTGVVLLVCGARAEARRRRTSAGQVDDVLDAVLLPDPGDPAGELWVCPAPRAGRE